MRRANDRHDDDADQRQLQQPPQHDERQPLAHDEHDDDDDGDGHGRGQRLHDAPQQQRPHDDDDDEAVDATWACEDHARVAQLQGRGKVYINNNNKLLTNTKQITIYRQQLKMAENTVFCFICLGLWQSRLTLTSITDATHFTAIS